MSMIKQIADGLNAGLEGLREALGRHDEQYGRHPATEADRRLITSELDLVMAAIINLTVTSRKIFDQGWLMACQWANRDDLIADMTSPQFTKERAQRLELNQPRDDWQDVLAVNLLRQGCPLTKTQIRALIAHSYEGVEVPPELFEKGPLELSECQVPPPGWKCTRGAGHEGPCAAVPADEWNKPEVS